MIKPRWLPLLLLIAITHLSGCGWHLRGQIDLPDEMRKVYLHAPSIGASQLRDIQQAFTLSKIELVPENFAPYTVQLFDINKERRVNSLGTDAVADSIALSLTADYAIIDEQGAEIIPRGPAKVSRSYNFDRDNLAAKNQEEQTIERELRQELAQQILRSFRFALRKQSTGDTPTVQTPLESNQPAVLQEQLDEQATPGATD